MSDDVDNESDENIVVHTMAKKTWPEEVKEMARAEHKIKMEIFNLKKQILKRKLETSSGKLIIYIMFLSIHDILRFASTFILSGTSTMSTPLTPPSRLNVVSTDGEVEQKTYTCL